MNAIVNVKLGRMVHNKLFRATVITIVALCFTCRLTGAQTINPNQTNQVSPVREVGHSKPSQAASAEQTPAHKYFTDVLLTNQHGEKMRFYSDLLQGKVVVINSFFGTCKGSCLPMNHNLEKLQQALGGRVGKDVHILSISVDPTLDTPERLKEYAKSLQAKPGWHFLTGDKRNVDYALSKIGHAVSNREDHLNIIIIGNERTGLWKKAFGLAPASELIKVVESVLNDQQAGDK